MDRAIPVMNHILHERWVEQDRVKQQKALDLIRMPVFSGRVPDPNPHLRDQARLRKMLKATSRKHRIEEEEQDRINHENKILYRKMTAILKKGAGNVSPNRTRKNFYSQRNQNLPQSRQDTDSILLHHGRSVTARPSLQMVKRLSTSDNGKAQILNSNEGNQTFRRGNEQKSPRGVNREDGPEKDGVDASIDLKAAKKSVFKKRWDSVNGRVGANLVVNRKSLNVEATKRMDNKIRTENLKFLEKLQQLKPSIDTQKLLKEHKEKESLVKRICTYPLSISHNATALTHQSGGSANENLPYSEFDSQMRSNTLGSKNMLLNQQDYLRKQRALESQPKMFDQAVIMRIHQTAKSGPRPVRQSLKSELPASAMFPQVDPAQSKPLEDEDEEEGAEFRNTNLINYNFNNNQRQEDQINLQVGTYHKATVRPQNTKGTQRFVKTSGDTDPFSDSEVYGMPRQDASQKEQSRLSPQPYMDDQIRQVTFSASQPTRQEKRTNSLPGSRQSSTVINQAANLNLNRIVLYKKGHFIDTANSYFIIEISSNAEGCLIIAAYDIQSSASLLINLKPDKAKKTLRQFNNDFQAIAEAVQVSDDGRYLRLLHKGGRPRDPRAIFSQDAALTRKMHKVTDYDLSAAVDQAGGAPLAYEMANTFDEWPELNQKLLQMRQNKVHGRQQANLSVEILNSLILQSQDRQNKVRRRLNNIQHQQKPNIKQMISFKKRGGRYQPFRRTGQNVDMLASQATTQGQSMYGARGSGKDDLYQSMNEGIIDGANGSQQEDQEQTSIQELPQEVMQAMEMEDFGNVEVPQSNRLVSKGESTLLHDHNNSMFDQNDEEQAEVTPQQVSTPQQPETGTRQQVARGGEQDYEAFSAEYTMNDLQGSTPREMPNSSSQYTVPAGSNNDFTEPEKTELTYPVQYSNQLVEQRPMKGYMNSHEELTSQSNQMEKTYNAKAKSDIAFQNIPQTASAPSSEQRSPHQNRAFTSHIPEERTNEYALTDQNSNLENQARNQTANERLNANGEQNSQGDYQQHATNYDWQKQKQATENQVIHSENIFSQTQKTSPQNKSYESSRGQIGVARDKSSEPMYSEEFSQENEMGQSSATQVMQAEMNEELVTPKVASGLVSEDSMPIQEPGMTQSPIDKPKTMQMQRQRPNITTEARQLVSSNTLKTENTTKNEPSRYQGIEEEDENEANSPQRIVKMSESNVSSQP